MGTFDWLPGANSSDPTSYEGMQLRQRLALQMMSRDRKGYPKNLGEGLTAIGDAIGDVGTMRRLEAMQAGMDKAAAARAAGVTAAPSLVPPKPAGVDPAASAEPTVQTADAAPSWLSGAQVSLPPPQQTAEAPPPPVQDVGSAPAGGDLVYPQTASLTSPDTASDAPPVGIQQAPVPPSINPAVRNAIAQQVMQRAAPGVQQPNPMLGGQSPATMPSTFSPDDLGSPPEAANNRPIVVPNVQVAQAGQGRLEGRPQVDITGIKPSGAASEPVPPTPAEPRYQAPPQTQPNWKFTAPPPMPNRSPQQVAAERELLNPLNSPSDRQRMQDIIGIEQKKREDVHKQLMEAWNSRNALTTSEYQKERERARNAAQIEVEQQEREQKRQQSDYAERITRHLGGRNPAAIEENLYKSRASVANIPAITQSLQRVNAVVDKMYTGPTADVNTFLSQLLPTFPGGFDPARGTATQQFRTAMTDIMAAHRAAVVGPGSQSGPELALLQKSTASDAKLNIDTVKESLAAAERLMAKTAIAHQQEVHNYAGNFDPDRTRSVFGSFGVPGIEDVVPQRTITKLMQHSGNDQAKKDFDETYHTPGLAEKLIQRELMRQGAPR